MNKLICPLTTLDLFDLARRLGPLRLVPLLRRLGSWIGMGMNLRVRQKDQIHDAPKVVNTWMLKRLLSRQPQPHHWPINKRRGGIHR